MLQLHRINGVLFTRLTSAAPNSLSSYLIDSLGFSRDEAIATSLKASFPDSKRNPTAVVDFFKLNGFNDTQIKKIVSKDPNVLRNDVEKTLIPKYRNLQDNLGLSPSELREFLADADASTLRSSTQSIRDAIAFLTPIFGAQDGVKVLRKSRHSFSVHSASSNFVVLQKHGFPIQMILKFFVRHPSLLQYNPKDFEEICAHIGEKFKYPVGSYSFLKMIVIFTGNTAENLSRKYHVFSSYGWTNSDIDAMITKYPNVLSLSEDTIRKKLEYFMIELGVGVGQISANPSMLGYSLEKRVFRRNAVLQVLKERKLIKASLKLAPALTITDSAFISNMVLPHEDELPGLYEAYKHNRMDSFIKCKQFELKH